MKTINLINLKGGVGKTTVSVHIDIALAESWDLRVLFIDNDKQANASSWLDADEERGSLTNILLDGNTAEEVIQPTKYEKLDLIAADMGLLEANVKALKDKVSRQDRIFADAIANIQSRYDVCVIDNPPDINMSVFNTMVVANDVIIVSLPEADSLSGIYKMADQMEKMRPYNHHLRLRGVLLNQYLHSDISSVLLDKLREKGFPLFQTKIRFATKKAKTHLIEARLKQRSIFEELPSCGVARDLMKFVEELMDSYRTEGSHD
ncbi:MAG: ParA family protein [Schwartzia sp.]|nr:ParA family protein [Schwartzia sp. (in: firmicutes)]